MFTVPPKQRSHSESSNPFWDERCHHSRLGPRSSGLFGVLAVLGSCNFQVSRRHRLKQQAHRLNRSASQNAAPTPPAGSPPHKGSLTFYNLAGLTSKSTNVTATFVIPNFAKPLWPFVRPLTLPSGPLAAVIYTGMHSEYFLTPSFSSAIQITGQRVPTITTETEAQARVSCSKEEYKWFKNFGEEES